MSRNIRIFLLIVAVIIVAGALFALSLLGRSAKPNLTIQVSPSVATVQVDGKNAVKPGTIYLNPGKHKITARFAGFASQTKQVTVKDGSVATVLLLLQPNSPAGNKWLQDHPDEAKNREGIGGRLFANSSAQQAQANPIIGQLPFLGPGGEYRIDYGVNPQDKNSSAIGIYITYYTPEGKQDALDWIVSQGYDPAQLVITYTDDTASYQGTNNPYTD